jgi:hypothetical protein
MLDRKAVNSSTFKVVEDEQAIHERLIALEPGRINSLILPKSPSGKAISYTLGQWTALQRYLEEGV